MYLGLGGHEDATQALFFIAIGIGGKCGTIRKKKKKIKRRVHL